MDYCPYCVRLRRSLPQLTADRLVCHHVSTLSSRRICQTELLQHLLQRDPRRSVVIGVALHRDL